MLSDLLGAVERLDIPVHGDAIAGAIRARDLLSARISEAVGEYDAQEQAALDGAHSTTGFLRQCGAARPSLEVKLARRMRDLPTTAAAWRRGDLTTAQVEAIVANVDDATVDQLAEHEADLVPKLASLSAHDTATVMRLWKAHADALVTDAPAGDQVRTAHLSDLLDGRGRLDADLDPEGMLLARTALRLAESSDCEGEESRSAARRRGDALTDIFRFFLDHRKDPPVGRNRPHVAVVVDWQQYERGFGGETDAGAPLSPATIKATLCDADVNRVVTEGRSAIIDYGTTTRQVSDNLFHALVLRDKHCRHPGCDRPPQWCHAHHVIPVEARGPTVLWNLVLKCSRHHHIGHLPGWTEKLEADGTLHLTAPDGRRWTTHAPGVLTLGLSG